MAVSDAKIYAGGSFTRIGGRRRSHLAVLDARLGRAGLWNPKAAHSITDLAVAAHRVFVATEAYDVPEQGLAAYERRSGRRLQWHPDPNDDVLAIARFGTNVFVGGSFTGLASSKRLSLAAVDIRSGALTQWNPRVDGSLDPQHPTVDALATDGRRLFVGGDFVRINGQRRTYVAAFDLRSGTLTSWDPGADDAVVAFAVSGSSIFAGGYFGLASIDAVTGAVRRPAPDLDGQVLALALAHGTLYVGGVFENINRVPRRHLAALDTDTLALRSWNPDVDEPVWTLIVSESTIYAGGVFELVDQKGRAAFAGIDPVTGQVQTDDLHIRDRGRPGAVQALDRHGSMLYLGGPFDHVRGVTTGGLVAFDLASQSLVAWLPRPDAEVDAIDARDDAIIVGGVFSRIGDVSQPHFAVFSRKAVK